jgi:DNA-binding transcriptional regulator YiaG
MKNKYQSKILQAIHEDMKGMHNLGIISDTEMREFDEDCLVKEPKKTHITATPARTPQSHIPA